MEAKDIACRLMSCVFFLDNHDNNDQTEGYT